MTATSSFRALIEKHCVTIRQMFEEFRTQYGARSLGEPPGSEAMVTLHTLKGSCGTIGFQDLYAHVARLHEQLKAWPTEQAARYGFEQKIAQEIAEAAQLVDAVKPEDSTLYGRSL
ncbi:Hpt domain-containing protein [Breoghania sp.]|uniref:Hpt domain-containing protein n=1 Tax=Breoghania sp. TaxID=2065378 RepID=UPI002AA68440|nr:Hpt domain-containing protein [Breoghania sp.]